MSSEGQQPKRSIRAREGKWERRRTAWEERGREQSLRVWRERRPVSASTRGSKSSTKPSMASSVIFVRERDNCCSFVRPRRSETPSLVMSKSDRSRVRS